jgi:hypothetical protein
MHEARHDRRVNPEPPETAVVVEHRRTRRWQSLAITLGLMLAEALPDPIPAPRLPSEDEIRALRHGPSASSPTSSSPPSR